MPPRLPPRRLRRGSTASPRRACRARPRLDVAGLAEPTPTCRTPTRPGPASDAALDTRLTDAPTGPARGRPRPGAARAALRWAPPARLPRWRSSRRRSGARDDADRRGRVLVAVLPDGSEVTLAPGSGLRVPRAGWPATSAGSRSTARATSTSRRPAVRSWSRRSTRRSRCWAPSSMSAPGRRAASETAVALVEGSVRFRSPGRRSRSTPARSSRVVGRGAPDAAGPGRRGGRHVVAVRRLRRRRRAAGVVVAAARGPVRARRLDGPGVDRARRLTLFLPSADTADAVLRDVAAYLDLRLQSGPDGFTVLAR